MIGGHWRFQLYLAPIFLGMGAHNFANFGNIDWGLGPGLGLPMAVLMVFLAASAELLGGVARYLVWRAACLSFR